MSVADTTVKHYLSVMSGAPALANYSGAWINVIDSCISGFGSVTLSSLTVANNIATGIVSNGHGFVMRGLAGPVIQISGAAPSSLNGVWRVAAVSSVNVFTFVTEGISDVTASGTITAKIAPYPLTKVYSGTYKAVYKFNDITSNGMYVRIDDTNNLYATLNMYEAMSDVDTGTGATPNRYLYRDSGTGSGWQMVGDNLLMFLQETLGLYVHCAAFGDITPVMSTDNFNSILIGGSTTAATMGGTANLGSYGYFSRSYTQLGGYVTESMSTYGGFGMGTGSTEYPNGPGSLAIFSSIDLYEGSIYTRLRGTLPGLVQCHHNTSNFTHLQSIDLLDRTILVTKSPTAGSYCAYYQISGPWR